MNFAVIESVTGRRGSNRNGGTLIEVMMACVVLAVIAIAGAAYIANSDRSLAINRERFQALALANSRMEEVRATKYLELMGLFPSGQLQVQLVKNGAIWAAGNSESRAVDNGDFITLVTAITKTDVVLDEAGYEGIMIDIEATCGASAPTYKVAMKTIYAP